MHTYIPRVYKQVNLLVPNLATRHITLQVGTVASDWNHDYYIESVPVVQVDVVKDLGIFVDKSLKFDHHINDIVARASIRLNLIHKCFISKDITVMTRAFVTYVRPLLEYASCVWSSHTSA